MNQIIETQLTTASAVTAGSAIPIGSVVHKRGNGLNASGSTITIRGAGYYKITASVTVEPTAVADMTVTLTENGSTIGSATETPAVAGDAVNVSLVGLVYNPCGCASDQIQLNVNSAGSVTYSTVIVERI